MDYLCLTLFLSEIFNVFSSQIQAPASIILNIKDSGEQNDGEQITLFSIIKTSKTDRTIYRKTDKFKSDGHDALEIEISFDVDYLSEVLIYKGNLSVISKSGIMTVHEFAEVKMEYIGKNTLSYKNRKCILKTLYSKDFRKELETFMSATCKHHYYPEHNCTVFCTITKNTEKCDSQGKKICLKGHYLNEKSGYCETDWCFLSGDGCKNNGKCVNKKNQLSCVCRLPYSGNYCENYIDYCQNYICPNGTFCITDNEKINCVSLKSKKSTYETKNSFLNLISSHTLISIFGFILIFIFAIGFTVWACRMPKSLRYRSMETSIHSNHSYYANNSISKASKYCFQCDQDNHQFLNTYHSIYGNRAYYSLKSPHNRLPLPINRAFSDLMLYNGDRIPSIKSLAINEESMPLPPPLETPEEDIML